MKLLKRPSNFIRQALRDLEVIENNPKYKVKMSNWHNPNGKCSVCLAGAVMANTLGCKPNESAVPSDFPKEIRIRLQALDDFRIGWLNDAFRKLNIDVPIDYQNEYDHFADIQIASYSSSRKQFKEDMHALADGLQGMGL